jgi:hypothetical protein
VFSGALLATLIIRLLNLQNSSTVGRFKSFVAAVERTLPMRVYYGLRWRAVDVNDDPFTHIEYGGYVFRTLFNRNHTPKLEYLESGALLVHGRQITESDDMKSRELPFGYEVCPADPVSIEVCATYEWSSLALLLGDGKSYRTRLNYLNIQKKQRKMWKKNKAAMAKESAASGDASSAIGPGPPIQVQQPDPQPAISPLETATPARLKIAGRVVNVEGGDVLIRKRCWSFV